MSVSNGLDRFCPPAEGVVATVGNFDGVHLGHQCIVETARDAARERGMPVVALTFEPHPLTILAPERAPARLTTRDEKAALLARHGADVVIVLRSDPELLGRSPEQFLAELVERCRPRVIVEGPTFSFGRERRGSVETLREHGARFGYALRVVEAVRCAALPGAPVVNSSAVRAALGAGRPDEAAALLGRPYRIAGRVGTGASRGAALGFPTANLEDIPHLLPGQAVYAAVAQLKDGRLYLAAVNVGPQPTFRDEQLRVEAFLVEYGGELRGRRIGLHFLARLRGQQTFAGPNELVEQLRRDVAAVRRWEYVRSQMENEPPIPL